WYTRDAFSIDPVEVYKGPSAFAFGRGATGGAINYVTRLPTGAQYLESSSTVSTGNGYRAVADATAKTANVSGPIQALCQYADPRRDLDQALGRRAVDGVRLPGRHQGDAVLYLSG